MADGMTNRARYLFMLWACQGGAPANFEAHLVTDTTIPHEDINVLSELEEIADGNGYAQSTGITLERNTTGFPTVSEDDTNDESVATMKDLVFSASGGDIPVSGDPARYMVVTTPEAGASNKNVLGWWDLAVDRTISDGGSLTVNNGRMVMKKPA